MRPEQSTLGDDDFSFHEQQYQQLRQGLETAFQASKLPDAPTARDALNDLLVRMRIGIVAPLA